MYLRDGRNGKFFGCGGYPLCKETMSERDAAIRADEDSSDRHDRDEEDMGIGLIEYNKELYD